MTFGLRRVSVSAPIRHSDLKVGDVAGGDGQAKALFRTEDAGHLYISHSGSA